MIFRIAFYAIYNRLATQHVEILIQDAQTATQDAESYVILYHQKVTFFTFFKFFNDFSV